MKEKILELLKQKSPESMTSQAIGFALGAQTTKDAINSVLDPLNSLINEKKIVFDMMKKEGTDRKDIYYSLKN